MDGVGTIRLSPTVVQGHGNRFWSRVCKRGPDECWPLKGQTKRKGYGRFRIGASRIAAHRIAFVLAFGWDPYPLQVDHKCHHRDCCNPRHLEAVTHDENQKRRRDRG